MAPEDTTSKIIFENNTVFYVFLFVLLFIVFRERILCVPFAFGKSLWAAAGTVGKHLSVRVHSRPLDLSPAACMLARLFACVLVSVLVSATFLPVSLSLCLLMIYGDRRLWERMCAFASLWGLRTPSRNAQALLLSLTYLLLLAMTAE